MIELNLKNNNLEQKIVDIENKNFDKHLVENISVPVPVKFPVPVAIPVPVKSRSRHFLPIPVPVPVPAEKVIPSILD